MPDLLLELRSEEIPARMQRKAAGDLRKMVTDGLVEAGLTYEAAREYWTPRRLALDIRGVTARSKDVREEIKGPPVKAPEAAVQGFLRKAGLTSTDQLSVQTDPKKGDFYVALIEKPGRAAEDVVAALMPGIIRDFPWPKSMRWGAASAPRDPRFYGAVAKGSESLRWVRPLQSILCTFGPETAEPVVVDFEVDGLRSGNVTVGHRFHAPGEITVRRFDDYVSSLEAAKVVLDAERRKQIILSDARNLAFASGLDLVEDEGLLEEVAGLVEWPVVLMGSFEEAFLAIPPEVVRLTIRANQKCFVTRPVSSPLAGEVSAEPTEGGGSASKVVQAAPPPPGPSGHPPRKGEGYLLAPRFILTANIEADDGGAEIVHGNGKVVRARLSDAVHFWKTDQSDLPDLAALQPSAEKFGLDLTKPLDQRMARLDHLGVTFHARLGTQGERVQRIAKLAEEIAASLSPSPLRGGVRGGGTPPADASHLTTHHDGDAGLPALARRAAVLAKADLQTEIVGEFPELQGAMGRKYALLQGEHPSVAAALEAHYKPQGPTDTVPTDPVAIAVALADKLDTLVGFWAIDEKPTGSKDPYALRRAALGVIRILVENGVRLGLEKVVFIQQCALLLSGFNPEASFRSLLRRYDPQQDSEPSPSWHEQPYSDLLNGDGFLAESGASIAMAQIGHPDLDGGPDCKQEYEQRESAYSVLHSRLEQIDQLSVHLWFDNDESPDGATGFTAYCAAAADIGWLGERFGNVAADLLSFFHDRLKVYLRDKGARHDLIDAVLAGGGARTSPLAGEVSGRTEGGGSASSGVQAAPPPPGPSGHPPRKGEGDVLTPQPSIPYDVDRLHSTTPPSALPGGASHGSRPSFGPPTGGEIGASPAATSSPLAGEVSAEPTEGGGSASSGVQAAPPPPGPSGHPPRKGEGAGANDDLLMIVRRVEALSDLLGTEDGKNLVAGTKRAANILAAEEKKGTRVAASVDAALLSEPSERALHAAVGTAEREAAAAIAQEDFAAAMRALAALRAPIDAFFEAVMVNAEDEAVRANRLALLARIRGATGQVADFSKIAG